jgi:uncharacterized membrane protein
MHSLARPSISFGARDAALVAVFAALSVVVIMFLPGIPVVGLSGVRITLDAAIAPLYGLVIGPYLGAFAALLGGIVVAGYKGWHIFSVLTSFTPAASALVAGMLARRNIGLGGRHTKGWVGGASILSILIAGWYLTWVGQAAPLYPVLQGASLAIVLVFRERIPTLFESGCRRRLFLAVLLSSYCGLISDHMLGNLIFILGVGWFIPLTTVESMVKTMGLPSIPALFMFVLPFSAVERIAMTLVASLFGTSLIHALRSTPLMPKPL